MMKDVFYSILEAHLFLRYLHLCREFFGHDRKRLDKKAKVTFKIYNVINSETNNYNTHITPISPE